MMRGIRRKEKAMSSSDDMQAVLREAKHITIAMCADNEPYLVTLSHGYDKERNCIYFHCAKEGKKIDILAKNNLVWGQALIDYGYQMGSCDHLYKTTQFRGRVTFIQDLADKEHALKVMIRKLDEDPESVIKKQITPEALRRVAIGRIDIDYMSGKKSDKIVIQT
jgi:nitroimidazol reductase NimA-like FMN-containing flavoprotein (pyridoxamine 5'-phosphate oxidase superfamily)